MPAVSCVVGQTDSTSSNAVEYNFVVRMFDDKQTFFNAIQHDSEFIFASS